MFGLFSGKKKKEFMSDDTKAYFHIYCGKNIMIDDHAKELKIIDYGWQNKYDHLHEYRNE